MNTLISRLLNAVRKLLIGKRLVNPSSVDEQAHA
jgi:hypothetical protein